MQSVIVSGGQSPVAFVPILVAALALAGILVATWAGFRTQRTHRLVENVTAERARWRQNVRAEAAKLSAVVVRGLARRKFDWAAFIEAETAVQVLQICLRPVLRSEQRWR